ncbi:MAG TPA: hypothetical protein VEK07_23335, partial [Polyangiaceae bacterium]|nr:hypothetical protein [Polyangiaceae bacterium]
MREAALKLALVGATALSVGCGGGPSTGETSQGGISPGGGSAQPGVRAGVSTPDGSAGADVGATSDGSSFTSQDGETQNAADSGAGTSDAAHADGQGGAESGACADPCPLASGLKHGCEQRFALGVNYAWFNFATDFGGLSAWGEVGVNENPSQYDSDLTAMHANGASAVRWWIFPDFRGDGVTFDSSGAPSGITSAAIADIQEALALAAKDDVYLVFTIF